MNRDGGRHRLGPGSDLFDDQTQAAAGALTAALQVVFRVGDWFTLGLCARPLSRIFAEF
jgi:hypothetical protein